MEGELIITPSSVKASVVILKLFPVIFVGLTTGITSRLYSLAKSRSRWSCAGQPKIAPKHIL
jgi:hypothetical protein